MKVPSSSRRLRRPSHRLHVKQERMTIPADHAEEDGGEDEEQDADFIVRRAP
jgi:hypothetical protein